MFNTHPIGGRAETFDFDVIILQFCHCQLLELGMSVENNLPKKSPCQEVP